MFEKVQAVFLAIVLLATAILPGCALKPITSIPDFRVGLRSSSYGPQQPFPESDYWISTSQEMSGLFPTSRPTIVWVVGEILFEGSSGKGGLSFPLPAGKAAEDYPNIVFSDTDVNETYFDQFDKSGVKVWLQVEPGNADVSTLIDLVMQQYGKHPCVIGFGVDVEWYKWDENSSPEGTAVTDAEAQAWSEKVRSYNPSYLLFVKHWLTEKMPPTYRTGIMFLDDSQEFYDLSSMVDEFKVWGDTFSSSPVGFQFGYDADQPWWNQLANPPLDIGQAILDAVPNTTDLYWVDFTMEQLWPRTP